MSKGPRIKPIVRQVIVGEAVKDRKKPRRQVMVELQNIIESMGEIVPAEETLEKLISSARNHLVSPLDGPWSLGCLGKYDMPPEALPAVLKIYEYRLSQSGHNFTIREALWIGRLYAVIDSLDFLERFTSFYAQRDHVDEILNNPPFTRDYDMLLCSYRENPAAFKESLGMIPLARTPEEGQDLYKKWHKTFLSGDQIID